MQDVFIKHNPYQLSTEIKINGKEPQNDSLLNFGEKRIQEWVEKLPEILREELSTKEINLTFHGREVDFQDVKTAFQNAKNITAKSIEYIPERKVEDRETAIEKIFNKIQACPYEEFGELKDKDLTDAFNLARSDDFEIIVIATMSAGKSTLINALLGQKLMPAQHEACTAIITRIRDNDSDHFEAKVYDKDENLIQTCPNLTCEMMEKLNKDENVSEIHIDGDIPFVGADETHLVLIDTPGPNNARNMKHRKTMRNMLEKSSKAVVLYIVNSGTQDDNNLLKYVSESMQTGGKQQRERFFFVLNKADDFKKGEDNIQEIIDAHKKDLEEKHHIKEPNIYPVSALTALGIRTALADKDSDEEDIEDAENLVRKFNRSEERFLERYAPLTKEIRDKIDSKLSEARKKGDANAEALIHCGIVPIELAIEMYVKKYAQPIKIKNILDTFTKKIDSELYTTEKIKEAVSSLEEANELYSGSIEKLQADVSNREELEEFKKKIEDEASNLSSAVKKEILEKMGGIQKEFEKILEEVTNTEKLDPDWVREICNACDDEFKGIMKTFQMDFEEWLEDSIKNSQNYLSDCYKGKLSKLAENTVGEFHIDPIRILQNDLDTSWIKKKTKSEEITLNPITWFTIIDKVFDTDIFRSKYIEREEFMNRVFNDMRVQFHDEAENMQNQALRQVENAKNEFLQQCEKLDKILSEKLEEMEKCAAKARNNENEIKKIEERAEWLEDIKKDIDRIMEI